LEYRVGVRVRICVRKSLYWQRLVIIVNVRVRVRRERESEREERKKNYI